jgi:hypothetical protein
MANFFVGLIFSLLEPRTPQHRTNKHQTLLFFSFSNTNTFNASCSKFRDYGLIQDWSFVRKLFDDVEEILNSSLDSLEKKFEVALYLSSSQQLECYNIFIPQQQLSICEYL